MDKFKVSKRQDTGNLSLKKQTSADVYFIIEISKNP